MFVVTPAPDPFLITTSDGCELELRRHPGSDRPVLLLHGASAASDTFRIGETRTLVDVLVSEKFDVWTLDWRASMRRLPKLYCHDTSTDFSIDKAVAEDVPAAIRAMRDHGVTRAIALVGHCMGGAIVAQGIAQDLIAADDVDTVVLTALGLFYRAAIDNVLKAEDGVLEELLTVSQQFLLHPTKRWDSSLCASDPGDGDWDPLLQKPYELWVKTPLRHNCDLDFCHRLSYMFGMPYLPDNIPTIHARALPTQFGYIPVQFLLHCTQNLRRGYAAPFVTNSRGRSLASDTTYLNRAAFRERKLTLITGDLNSLWHRDSIDTMYEWLCRGTPSERPRSVTKHVIAGYGHQDLYWGLNAPTDVFRHIVEALQVNGLR